MNVIFDKYGEAYQIAVSDDLGPSFHIRFQNPNIQPGFIGNANFLWEDEETLLLADIRLNDKAIIVYRRTGLFWRFRKVRREEKNFQHIGLGTALLKNALEYVKQMGIKKVVGKIKRHDFEKNPNLPRWYAGMGFSVTMEIEPSAVVARISKQLVSIA